MAAQAATLVFELGIEYAVFYSMRVRYGEPQPVMACRIC